MTPRQLLRAARHAPDLLLHRRRRGRLRRRLAGLPHPRDVLFVCQGNIYRSPFAAAVFLDALPPERREELRVTSAGFVGPGRGSPEDAVALASAGGIDLSAHRSSLITAERAGGADLVVVMDPEQRRRVIRLGGIDAHRVVVLGDLDPEGIRTRAIVDPWRQEDGILGESYARVERCTRELVRAVYGRAVPEQVRA